MKTGIASIVILLMIATSSTGYARNSRGGFNFGASLKMHNLSDRGTNGHENNRSNQTIEEQTISPYAGFVVGEHLNIGVALSFENSLQHSSEEVLGSSERVERTRESSLRNVSLFSRFLFGEFMFFEAGFGLYDQNINVENQYTFGNNDDSFSGKREQYSVRGVGPGYHIGGGFEVELGRRSGFFLTGAYLVRSYTLKQVKGGQSLGEELSSANRQEITFGIAHYVN